MPHDLVSSQKVYEGRFVDVRLDTVDIGSEKIEREVVEEKSDGVLIAPLTDDGKIILVRQSRHLFGTTYEVPSGAINNGETPLEAAIRELREEAGLDAAKFDLISCHVNGVHLTGRNYYFIARGLTICERPAHDADEEFLGQVELDFESVDLLIEEGKMPDVRNRGCIWLTQLRLLQERIQV